MYMIKVREINILVLALSLACACSSDDWDTLEDQREDIVEFLTEDHDPLLIAESDLEDQLEDDLPFYSTFSNTAYRYIEDYYNEDRLLKTEATKGDTLELTFWCYDFSSFVAPSDSYLYYTNDPSYESALAEAGLNTEYWSFEPLKIVLGDGDILNAIETSLLGCREGDKVEIYLTYNIAYGSNWIGVTTLESPIAFVCTIDSIEN